jgi:hypothetical protein
MSEFKFKTTRRCAGCYEVWPTGTILEDIKLIYDLPDDPADHHVEVNFYSPTQDGTDFTGWIARASWTSDIYTDPCSTKAEAVAQARAMLTRHADEVTAWAATVREKRAREAA